MLADVIDYDMLLSGSKRQALYVMVEACIIQLVEIVAQAVPPFEGEPAAPWTIEAALQGGVGAQA